MARRPQVDRARRWAALAAIVGAAALCVGARLAQRSAPGWPPVDEYQARLDALRPLCDEVARRVPAGEALQYACPLDAQGRPSFDGDSFAFLVAVLAPRRIGLELEARYLVTHLLPLASLRQRAGLEDARLLAEFGDGFALVERAAP